MSNSHLIKAVQADFLQKGREEIKTGMEIEVHQIIKENGKERIQKYKGLVIKTAGKSLTGKAARLKEVQKVVPAAAPKKKAAAKKAPAY